MSLLFLFLTTALLLLTFLTSDHGCLHQLSYHSFLLLLILLHHGLPHFVYFALSSDLRILLHAILLFCRIPL